MLYEKIINGEEKISLVGLGYVGMPIAVSFSKKVKVIGFDINKEKVELYKKGIDPTKEVGDKAISECSVEFTSDETKLKEAKFHIVAVPTPVRRDHTPDLTPVESASEVLGRNLTKGSIVVYESTVYPGVTEDVCIPILEKESGMKLGDVMIPSNMLRTGELVFLDDVTTADVEAALGVKVVINGPEGKDFVEAVLNPKYRDGRDNGNFVYIKAYDR